MDQKMMYIYREVETYEYSTLYEVEFSQDACGY